MLSNQGADVNDFTLTIYKEHMLDILCEYELFSELFLY